EAEKKAEEQKRRADSIAQAQEKIAAQKKVEAEKKAEEQKRRADSIAQAQEKIATQKKVEKEQKTEIVEKKEEKKTPETNKIIKNEEPTSSKNSVVKSTLFSNDSVKKEFVATFKNFIEALRNYDYAKANQFIHPTFHFYVTYNIESLPSVREFNNFEKFFAVFSAFTSKGTSYDFSVDLENMIKKNNFKFDGMPTYNCEKHMYMPTGIIVSEINGSVSKLIEDTRKYYKSMNAEFLPVIEERLQNAENSIQVAVVDSDNRFIESLYFGKIENKWYLIVMDLKIKCK
ncbi:MAG: cell envelope integrity protein TolA, partial [Candidatus Kapaibacteriota bacterium]